MAVLFWIFFWIRSVQNKSNLIKLDFLQIKKCYRKKLSNLQKRSKWMFFSVFF